MNNNEENLVIDNAEELDELTVTLTLDDDEELECSILCIFKVDKQEYIALLPLSNEDDEQEEDEVFIYRYSEVNGVPELENIEDDSEYENAADAFDEWLDQQEFDEIQSELDAAE